MLGTLAYTALDVGFNIVLWAGVKSVTGMIYLYNYATSDNSNANNELNMIEYNVNNNDLKDLIKEIKELKEEIKELKQD